MSYVIMVPPSQLYFLLLIRIFYYLLLTQKIEYILT